MRVLLTRPHPQRHMSRPEHRLAVPLQVLPCGRSELVSRRPDFAAIEHVVVPPVLELFPDARADSESHVRRHRHVPAVEEGVQIGA